MEFKKWLKNKKFGLSDFEQGQIPNWLEDKYSREEFDKENPNFILVSDLGECYLNQFLKSCKFS